MRLGSKLDLESHEWVSDEGDDIGTEHVFHQLILEHKLIELKFRKRVGMNNYLIFVLNEDKEQQCANPEVIVNLFLKDQYKTDLSKFYNGLEFKQCLDYEPDEEDEGLVEESEMDNEEND